MTDGNRRSFLALAGAGPLVLLGIGATARAADAPACFDPDQLSASQRSMRKTLGFTPASTDPAKSCGGCAFFSGTASSCGKCQLLSGGPVSSTSACRSWAKRG